MLRSVAKSAAVLIALMFIERIYAGRASSETELSDILHIDVRTVRGQLSGLSAVGLITCQGRDRWMLTPEGRGTLFGENSQPSLLSIEDNEPLLLDAEISAQNVPHDMNDDAKNVLSDSDSSSIIHETQNVQRTKQILQATAVLFNDTVFITSGMQLLEPDFVLGWVAKAYADRERLNNPLGLLYRRLNEMASLPVMYRKNPVRGLPAEFLREIGMVEEAEKIESLAENVEVEKVDMSDYLRQLNESRNQLVEYIYPAPQARDSFGRNLRWLEIIKDARYEKPTEEKNKDRRGIGFAGDEPVQFEGSKLVVTVTHHGSREEDYAALANQWYSGLFSEIYQDQSGDPSARVEFVAAVRAVHMCDR